MAVEVNGIAHIQLTVSNPAACVPFWEGLCHFLSMETLIRNDNVVYCIGSRTGILVRGAPEEHRDAQFNQDRSGLHHFCFRARSADDVDAIYAYVQDSIAEQAADPNLTSKAKIVHGPEDGSRFAPGYYSILFEDPDGLRVEVNYVPGKGHFGESGRLGGQGDGPANEYGDDGLTNV